VEVIDAELRVEPRRHKHPGEVAQLRLAAHGGRWLQHNLHPAMHLYLQSARSTVQDDVVLVAGWREPPLAHHVAL
jgi:hypothetical protein